MAPVKRDHMGLPRLDAFEITRIALCKMSLKSWFKLVEDSSTSAGPEDEEDSVNYETLT
jgi:hypothetical protein